MRSTIAIILAVLALLLSIVVLFRNPYERIQAERCDRQRSECNNQCELLKNQAYGRLSLDSTSAVLGRNQDLLSCQIENIGNPTAIAECQQRVNDEFNNFLQQLSARRAGIDSAHEDCIENCTNAHQECYNNLRRFPPFEGGDDDGTGLCPTKTSACTITIPAPCDHTEIEIKVSCEELECMGIPCRGDIPELPVCVQPGPIEDGFNLDYKIVNNSGKEIDRFPALQPEPNCKFSLRKDKETLDRLNKYARSQIHLVVTSKAKPPLTISFVKSEAK